MKTVIKQPWKGKLWTWKEQHLYGSSRLGMWRPDIEITGEIPDPYDATEIGTRNYELTNHLGNVLTVISDKLTFNGTNYEAEVLNVQDYYPGGMQMSGRTFNAGSYAYGFNGKRKDNEIKGEGNSYDFDNRIYDPRIVRWLSVDPLQAKLPSLSPYNFCYNNPLNIVDRDGKLGIHVIAQYNSDTKTYTLLSITVDDDLKAVPYSNRAGQVVEHPDIGMNYFDYAEITLVDENGRVLSTQNKTLSFRTNNWVSGKWWAKEKVNDGQFESGGGIMWTSQGQTSGSQGARKGKPEFSENLDALMAAINGYKGLGDHPINFDKSEVRLAFLEKLTALLGEVKDKKPGEIDLEDPAIKQSLEALSSMLPGSTSETNNPAATQVYVREDDYGSGPRREKKGSVQDHTYFGDSVTRKKSGANGSKPDSTFIIHKKRKIHN